MPVSMTLQEIPIGSQYVSTIGSNDEADKNDFRVRIPLDGNGTGLTLSNITVSAGSVVAVRGEKSVWEATIRPPTTAQMLTITIAANAFDEGNVETTKDIRVSTSFPDTDAETPTELFDPNVNSINGIAVTPTRILLNRLDQDIYRYTHAGTEQTAERLAVGQSRLGKIDSINDSVISRSGSNYRRYSLSDGTLIESYVFSGFTREIVHTAYGVLAMYVSDFGLELLPYGKTAAADVIDIDAIGIGANSIAHQDGLIFIIDNAFGAPDNYALAKITAEDSVDFVKFLNIEENSSSFSNIRDIAIYRDTLYILEGASTDRRVYTLDIRPYRPLAKNTKTTIYPIFATNGDTIPLKQYCPDGKEFIFSVGFDKPTFLSINSSNEIAIASNAVTETTPVLVRCTGINYIDSADFSFYLIIMPALSSTWRTLTH